MPLNQKAIKAAIAGHKNLQQVIIESGQECISQSFSFNDFAQTIAFVNTVAELAEVKQHHPRFIINWNHVELLWWTHDTAQITELDLALAKLAEQTYQKYPQNEKPHRR